MIETNMYDQKLFNRLEQHVEAGMTYQAEAIERATALISQPLTEPTHREAARQFHDLAMLHVRTATHRRRWLRLLDQQRPPSSGNPSIRAFYGDLWTPECASLVSFYRGLARTHRKAARVEAELVRKDAKAAVRFSLEASLGKPS